MTELTPEKVNETLAKLVRDNHTEYVTFVKEQVERSLSAEIPFQRWVRTVDGWHQDFVDNMNDFGKALLGDSYVDQEYLPFSENIDYYRQQ